MKRKLPWRIVPLVVLAAIGFAVAQARGNRDLGHARADLKKAKAALATEGKYGCCIKGGCDQCALAMEGCPCGKMLAEGKPVCPECKGGWVAGRGELPGVKAADVKVAPDEMLGKMSMMRAMQDEKK